jgi:hypothetical protein
VLLSFISNFQAFFNLQKKQQTNSLERRLSNSAFVCYKVAGIICRTRRLKGTDGAREAHDCDHLMFYVNSAD